MPRRAQYPCGICSKACGANTIECSQCLKWIHSRCVPLTLTQLKKWSQNGLAFVCRNCAFNDETETDARPVYNYKAALERLYDAVCKKPGSASLADAVKAERLMFKTYKIEVPSPLTEPAPGHTDKSAQQILQSLHPVILEDFIPAQVVGDGNCLYRAISRAMYGREDNHLLLRLVTALEIAENRSNYDITAKDHVDMIRDDRVVLDTYDAFLRAAARPGSFSDLLHMYAASAALNLPIHSYCPPTTFGSEFLSGPLTRRVYGRGVRQTAIPDVTKKDVFIPMDPQPDPEHLLLLHRNYAKHSQSAAYKRRVSWIGNPGDDTPKVMCVEYIGTFPGRAPHGNAKDSKGQAYIRTPADVMDTIKAKVKTQPPNDVYRQQILDTSDVINAPRKLKQVQDAKYRQNKRQNKGNRGNFADHVQNIESMVQTHPFVQRVVYSKDKVPAVILFTPEQIQDIKRFCCSAPAGYITELGFDKTFNLGELHVTVGVYKHLAVVKKDTQDHPLFVGPIYLHGNSDFSAYGNFFTHIAAELDGVSCPPILGSDDEKAMRKAMDFAFPDGHRLTCTLHMKKNVIDYLKDKVGINSEERQAIVTAIFGADGLINADDELVFDYRAAEAKELSPPEFKSYFSSRIVPCLRENLKTSKSHPTCAHSLLKWTNNNCESVNSVLKHVTNWRPQALTDLVLKLYTVVQAQFKDLEHCLVGQGNFKLCEPYKKFAVPIDVWSSMDKEKRDRHFARFTKQMFRVNEKLMSSGDGERIVMTPTNGGKKPGQRHRKRCARTTSIKRPRKLIKLAQ